jgi:hypothetical protein
MMLVATDADHSGDGRGDDADDDLALVMMVAMPVPMLIMLADVRGEEAVE